MTMNIGDIVMTPKGVARVTENMPDHCCCLTTRGCFEWGDIHLLADVEAFEIAGHAVQDDGYHGHRLDYALESAILKGFGIGEAVTPATLKTMFAETRAEIKKVME